MSVVSVAELAREGALDGLELANGIRRAERLRGHASSRRFYRLRADGGAPSGAVLVVYPPDQADELDRYVRAATWFREAGVRVPMVHDRGRRALLVEDGGRVLLDEGPRESGTRRRLYRQAVDAVSRIQAWGRRNPGPNPGRALDRERLHRELLFFEEHAIRGWLRMPTGASTRAPMFELLATVVAALPVVECHRDYHSRNLLAAEHRLMVLDFQDVMRGPLLYDMASLVRDDYCDVPDAARGELLARFWRASGRPVEPIDGARIPDRPRGLPAAARQAFALVGLQRSLKALGTFGYQVTVAGNPEYERLAPRTRGHVLRSLELLGWTPASVGLQCLGEAAR